MSRGHEQYEENVGAYLLGALPELEAEVFEKHVASCADCRRELEQLRLAAEALPRAVEPVIPPPELKESIMRTVWAEAEERREATPKRRWSLERLPRLSPALAAAAAACVLAIGIGIGVGVANLGGGSSKTLTALVDHTRAPSANASLYVPGSKKGAILNVQGVPNPGPGKVYEVWVQRDGTMQPAGALFSVSSGGSGSAGIPGSLKGVQAVAVTAERDGGAAKPTQMPLLTVKLS
ncbi:MAG TPA: anti-sigma factor [Thermoleophilaceae bacterium]|nr:anti-sigma factor [Thermoleophilaceae bacterium]